MNAMVSELEMKPFGVQRQTGSPFWYAEYYIWCADSGKWKRRFKSTRCRDEAKALGIAEGLARAAHGVRWSGWNVDMASKAVKDIMLSARLPMTGVERVTLGVFLDRWLAVRSKQVKPTSMEVYTGVVDRLKTWAGKSRLCQPLDVLTGLEMQDFWDWLVKQFAKATVARTVRLVESIFAKAAAEGLIKGNPAKLIEKGELRKVEDGGKEPFSAEQLGKVLAVCKARQAEGRGEWLTAALLGLCTGARLMDVVKFGSQTLQVEDGIEGLVFSQQKTGKPVFVPLVEPLKSHVAGKRGVYCAKLSKLDQGWLSSAFGAIVDEALGVLRREGIADGRRQMRPHSFHSFRHTLPTLMISGGVEERISMAVVGHRTTSSHRKYVHPPAAVLQGALEAGLAAVSEIQSFGSRQSKGRKKG